MFSQSPPYLMLMDINSCFATIEQQANPLLRGKPVVVGAYTTNRGCVLAASREAKVLGVKTGMYVQEARARAPDVVVLPPDPPKYRWVNRKLQTILASYSPDVEVKSIDEMLLDMRYTASMKNEVTGVEARMVAIAKEIKKRVAKEIGEWVTLSMGIAPNRYLAKVASNLTKPDGLHTMTGKNVEHILGSLVLEELPGIKTGYGSRLRRFGITTALALYQAPIKTIALAFNSQKVAYGWWMRLHGYEVDEGEDVTKTIGHSYALPKGYVPQDRKLHQILCQLTEKMARRLRAHDYRTSGVHVSCVYTDFSHWGHGEKQALPLFAGDDLYERAKTILLAAPAKPVRILAVSSYLLTQDLYTQQSLLAREQKKEQLMQAIDAIDDRWGDFSVFPGRMLGMEQKVLDRIAFGGAKDLARGVQ